MVFMDQKHLLFVNKCYGLDKLIVLRKRGHIIEMEKEYLLPVIICCPFFVQKTLLKAQQSRELGAKYQGMGGATKLDEFLEKFQTAFDRPPPSFFGKLYSKYF